MSCSLLLPLPLPDRPLPGLPKRQQQQQQKPAIDINKETKHPRRKTRRTNKQILAATKTPYAADLPVGNVPRPDSTTLPTNLLLLHAHLLNPVPVPISTPTSTPTPTLTCHPQSHKTLCPLQPAPTALTLDKTKFHALLHHQKQGRLQYWLTIEAVLRGIPGSEHVPRGHWAKLTQLARAVDPNRDRVDVETSTGTKPADLHLLTGWCTANEGLEKTTKEQGAV